MVHGVRFYSPYGDRRSGGSLTYYRGSLFRLSPLGERQVGTTTASTVVLPVSYGYPGIPSPHLTLTAGAGPMGSTRATFRGGNPPHGSTIGSIPSGARAIRPTGDLFVADTGIYAGSNVLGGITTIFTAARCGVLKPAGVFGGRAHRLGGRPYPCRPARGGTSSTVSGRHHKPLRVRGGSRGSWGERY